MDRAGVRRTLERKRALRITAVYAVLAAAWIYASDSLLAVFFSDPQLLTLLATYKGWAFVAITSALLYSVVKRSPSGTDGTAPEDAATFSIWPPLVIFIIFVAVVSTTAYLAYVRIAGAARTKAEETLGAIADLKSGQLADWIRERRGNAERASHDPFMAAQTESWLRRGAPDDDTAAQLRARLKGLRTAHDWNAVYFVDPNGEVRLDATGGAAPSAATRAMALQAIRSARTLFWDLHPSGTAAEMTCFAPLLVGDASAPHAIGAVVMTIDPEQHLYAMIQRWPLPSQSGETLIVRREGDEVVYLTRLRHSAARVFQLRLPLSSKELVAAMALRGAGGSLSGVDYRGVPVVACARKVPLLPWVLIAKIDQQEVNGPVVESARLAALFGLVLVIAAGLATLFWLRQQRTAAVLREYRAERDRAALAHRLDYLTRYANDMILLIDGEGTIIDANERAVSTYRYTREELLGRNIRELRAPADAGSFQRQWSAAADRDGVVFESLHRRKDGAVFPVEVSARGMDVNGVILRQSIIRDITERKDAEQRIVRLSNLYAALSDMNQAIVRGTTRDELLRGVCRVAVECASLELAWVGIVDHAGSVRPMAVWGNHADYLDRIHISTDQAHPAGGGPTGTAIRTGRSQVSNDLLSDKAMAPWHEAARDAGFRASAAFPLSREGQVIGTLNVYSDRKNAFDADTMSLLDKLSGDLAFALQSLEKEERRRAAEEALRESEEKYRLLFNAEQDGIVVFDAETTRIVDTNEAFRKLSGYTEEEARTLHVRDLSTDPDASNRSILAVRARGVHRVDARRLRHKDGTESWIELGLNTFVWHGTLYVSAILRDISERKKAEENALLWGKVLEDSAEGIIITDAERKILTVNKAFTTLTGYTAEEVAGRDPGILSSGRHDRAFYHVMWRTIRETSRWEGEIWNRRKNGEVYPGWLSITAVKDGSGALTHYLGIFSDTSERKESAERIQFLASHDSLTSLPNRLLISDLARQSVAASRRSGVMVALLFLDLDRFKTINDSLGHAVGDVLLQRVAARLTDCLRECDTVARVGGDEFVVVLPELPRSSDAAIVAEKIITLMRMPLQVDQHELSVTASIGISIYPHDGADVATLIKNADAAMYHAKERGRNNYQFFTPDMNARAFEALSMEMSLRGALDRGEFSLCYQPQVQTDTGRVIGVEALLRWHHRDLGFVPPSRFIPIAEEHGLIVSIGDWVLRRACRQIREWVDQGLPPIPVAVNVSAVQFRQPDLARRIRTILEESGIAPQYLELELTETTVMRDAGQARAVLLELAGMGVSVSIDDFGTGYSSLSSLRRFPIHKLKIDQSFVADIPSNPDAAAIATAVIGMGRSLKLRVIAEGVETVEQADFLRRQQCDELQGFYISRPLQAEQMAALLRTGRPLGSPPHAPAVSKPIA